MITIIDSQLAFDNFIQENDAVLLYFSHEECNVCKILKPKIEHLLSEEFDKMKMAYINIKKTPEISAQSSIFTVPTITIHFDGKEHIRKSRNISIYELKDIIDKPY